METIEEKNGKTAPPSVAIDGTAIKALREAKKLTQLYVASVVGVTTDTISRWENNRYPTVKRDNAEKLAAALEVDIEQILRKQEVEPVAVEHPPPPQLKHRHWLLVLLVVVILIIGLFVAKRTSTTPIALRWLPSFAAPGEVIPVQVKLLRREQGVSGIILREQLPAGWQLIQATPNPSTGEKSASEIKWLIPAGSGPVVVSYSVRVPPDFTMGSQGVFDGKIVLQRGDATRTEGIPKGKITVDGHHWADSNGDGRIDDNEIMPAYYITEDMKGFDLDWKTIEAIWSAKGYSWESRRKEFVIKR
jgi:transcriptional regulator with XRE-family HTH domain